MTIRLLACDIDDTLVRFPHPPSPAVAQALRDASNAGVTVALVTGRAFRRAQPVAQMLGLTAPLVCNHGGSIRMADGRTVHSEMAPRALILEAVTWLQTQDVRLIVFDGDHVYHDCTGEQVVPDFRVYTSGERTTFVRDLRPYVPAETENLLITALDRDHLSRVYQDAQSRFGDRLRVLFAHPYGIDILSLRATKAQALAWLAAQIGADQGEVMAIGDGHNDMDMLAWAGLGVAMGDASAPVKAVADVIAPPFDQDGVAWAVNKYILTALRCSFA